MLFSAQRVGCADMDAKILGRWLDTNGAPGNGEEPVLEQLTGGSQNTLYLVRRGDRRMGLRMPGARAGAGRGDGLVAGSRPVPGPFRTPAAPSHVIRRHEDA